MMRTGVKLLGCASGGAVALVLMLSSGAHSQSQGDSDDEAPLPSMPTSEPAIEPMGTTARWEAHTPYASDPGAVTYEQMNAVDKAVVDNLNASAEEHGAVLAVYAASAQQEFVKGMTKLAQLRLGLDQLDQIGVVGGEDVNSDGADGTPGHGASGLDEPSGGDQ